MSALDFQDREPELDRARRPNNQVFAGNHALYERLQGQGRKSAIERYGWIAVPIAIVAVIGVAAATSVPHKSSDDVGGPPAGVNTASTATPAPAPAAPASPANDTQAGNDAAKTPAADTPAPAES